MTRFLLYCIVCLLVYPFAYSVAQTSVSPTTSWGTWLVGTVQLPSGPKKWGGFAEVQARSNGVFQQFFYNELKGGVSYDLDSNFTLTVAGGHYATYDYQALSDGPLNTEKRLWEQLVISQYLARLKFEHRYRIEQRWFAFRDGANSFRNRIRYRLNMFVPVNNRTITEKTAFLSVYDEIFFNPVGPSFERNRLFAGVGYQLDRHWVFQIGLVNQTNYSAASFEDGQFTPQLAAAKNNLIFILTYRLKRTGTSEKVPSQPD